MLVCFFFLCSDDLRDLYVRTRAFPTRRSSGLVERQLAGLASLLEIGCGEATMAAARQVRRIVSVDSDPARLRTVQAEVACEAVEFAPVHIDIGPVRDRKSVG